MNIISKQQARQFLLKKQLLFSPKSLSGKEGIEEVFNTLRVIQYDPLNPCGRNPDLVLQSRIKDYHPNDYYKWLYENKKGIEVYDKELCIIPIEDLDYVSHRQLKAQLDESRKAFLKTYASVVSQILEQIKQNGPITSSDIKLNKQVISGWGSTALVGRIALEQLWKMGQLVVVKREGMKKYYDLPKQITPPTKLAKVHILRRLKSVGLLPKTTTGGGWQGLSGIATFINSLIEEQKILEIKIENSKLNYLILKEDYELLVSPVEHIKNPKISFIAPLDNLIWDRKMIEDIFDFHYRWEVYTPSIKRQFGYYVLPILYGDEFIGRIEPVKNSKANTLEIRGLWFERKWTKAEYEVYAKALNEFNKYLQTSKTILQTNIKEE